MRIAIAIALGGRKKGYYTPANFKTTNSASDNVTALQDALDNHRKVLIKTAGTYEIDGTIWIPSDTELKFVSGCTIKKVANVGTPYTHVFANKGILTGARNSNIKLYGNGLEILVNSVDGYGSAAAYRMRGQINFFRVDGLTIDNIYNDDNGADQFYIHLADVVDYSLSNLTCEGSKDGVHIHKALRGTITNIVTDTADDAIALLCTDYTTVTPIVGDIEDLTITNWTNASVLHTGGSALRTSVSSWKIWTTATHYFKADICVNAGNIYIKDSAGDQVSSVAPTHTSGKVTGADSIEWGWLQAGTITETFITGLKFKDVVWNGSDPGAAIGQDNDETNLRATFPGTAGNAYIEDMEFDNLTWNPSAVTNMMSISTAVKSLVIKNSDITPASGADVIVATSGDYTFFLDDLTFDNCDITLASGHYLLVKAASFEMNNINIVNSNGLFDYQNLFNLSGTEHIDVDLSGSTLKTVGEIIGTDITITAVGTQILDANDVPYPLLLCDNHTVGWYDSEFGVTKDGSDVVSAWNSKKLVANSNLVGNGTPHYTADGMLLDGVGDYFESGSFTFSEPCSIYMVMKQITWTNGDRILDGKTGNTGGLLQNSSTPNIACYAGAMSSNNGNLALDTWGIVEVHFDGANSRLKVDDTATVAGDFGGAATLGGIHIGCFGGESNMSNIQVKEVILRLNNDTTSDALIIYNYLLNKFFFLSDEVTVDDASITVDD